MMHNRSQFNIIFNQTLFDLETYLDQYDYHHDLDYEINNQMMTISFSKKNKIIISQQEAYQQLWLATKSNAYHFNYQKKKWICNRSNQNFWKILEKSFYIDGNEKIDFSKFYNI